MHTCTQTYKMDIDAYMCTNPILCSFHYFLLTLILEYYFHHFEKAIHASRPKSPAKLFFFFTTAHPQNLLSLFSRPSYLLVDDRNLPVTRVIDNGIQILCVGGQESTICSSHA